MSAMLIILCRAWINGFSEKEEQNVGRWVVFFEKKRVCNAAVSVENGGCLISGRKVGWLRSTCTVLG